MQLHANSAGSVCCTNACFLPRLQRVTASRLKLRSPLIHPRRRPVCRVPCADGQAAADGGGASDRLEQILCTAHCGPGQRPPCVHWCAELACAVPGGACAWHAARCSRWVCRLRGLLLPPLPDQLRPAGCRCGLPGAQRGQRLQRCTARVPAGGPAVVCVCEMSTDTISCCCLQMGCSCSCAALLTCAAWDVAGASGGSIARLRRLCRRCCCKFAAASCHARNMHALAALPPRCHSTSSASGPPRLCGTRTRSACRQGSGWPQCSLVAAEPLRQA